jgi:hypothetical protein
MSNSEEGERRVTIFHKLFVGLWPKHIWIIPFLVISPAVFLIHNDVFMQYPWAKTYADWLAQWIPMIDRAAHLHPHPDKFRAFFAYAWSCIPICLFLARIDGREKSMRELKARGSTPLAFIVMLVMAALMALLVYAPGDSIFDSSLLTRRDSRFLLYSNDISLFLLGPLQVYAFCIFCVGFIRWIRVGIATVPHVSGPVIEHVEASEKREG